MIIIYSTLANIKVQNVCTCHWLREKNTYFWSKNHPIPEINIGQNLKMTKTTYFVYSNKCYDLEMVKNDQEYIFWGHMLPKKAFTRFSNFVHF